MAGRLVIGAAVLMLGALASNALAVRLGQVTVHSAIYERLDAEVPLTRLGRVSASEIQVSLGSREDFQRLDMQRETVLESMRFAVGPNNSGNLVIHLTSSDPMPEPFLHFLLDVRWPGGSELREYSLLLDPQGDLADNRPPAPPQRSARRPAREAAGDRQVYTSSGDTLWALANRLRPSTNVSVDQMMLAIQKANPDAFFDGNINRLKAGYLLLIPEEFEIAAIDSRQATREVNSQNIDWRSPGRTGTPDRILPEATGGELRVTGRREAEAVNQGRIEELQSQLDETQEELDRSTRANTELNARLQALTEQLETLNRLVGVQGRELARLRAELRRAPGSSPAPAGADLEQTLLNHPLFNNPWVLIGLGVFSLLLVSGVLIYIFRPRPRPEPERRYVFGAQDELEEIVRPVSAHENEEDEGEAESGQPPIDADDLAERLKHLVETGNLGEAVQLMRAAIEQEPDRTDLRLKLLELLKDAGDREGFEVEKQALAALGDEEANLLAEAMWQEPLVTEADGEAQEEPLEIGKTGTDDFGITFGGLEEDEEETHFNPDHLKDPLELDEHEDWQDPPDDDEQGTPEIQGEARLDLARALLETGDPAKKEEAGRLLEEVLENGSEAERREAEDLHRQHF